MPSTTPTTEASMQSLARMSISRLPDDLRFAILTLVNEYRALQAKNANIVAAFRQSQWHEDGALLGYFVLVGGDTASDTIGVRVQLADLSGPNNVRDLLTAIGLGRVLEMLRELAGDTFRHENGWVHMQLPL